MWFLFLVLVQVLLLSLVLDTLVAAYSTDHEEVEEAFMTEKVSGVVKSFETLTKHTGEEGISKETFLNFAMEIGRSPRCRMFSRRTAEIMFQVVDRDQGGYIDELEFTTICGVMQYEFWVTRQNSFIFYRFPHFWHGEFAWFREKVSNGSFDWLMNVVLLFNLMLVVLETVWDLYGWNEPTLMENLEFIFSFIYVAEVALRLSVESFGMYWSTRANQFDFFTTWALLASSVIETLIQEEGGTTNVKRYMNILRLLRLLRVLKQLKRLKAVQFMVNTISKLVTASKDILMLLGVVTFFFTTLSVQLWGGLLYVGNPNLEGTLYVESKYYVFNFNDFLSAVGVWVVMLLCKYVPKFAYAISATSGIHGSWIIFPMFYIFGVSIVFELVKAFTIEIFIDLNKKRGVKEEEFEALKELQEDLAQTDEFLHYRMVGDVMVQEKLNERVREYVAHHTPKSTPG